jgi:hypothetical protein
MNNVILKMANSHKILGHVILIFSGSLWAYYTLWIMITPIIDIDHPIQ